MPPTQPFEIDTVEALQNELESGAAATIWLRPGEYNIESMLTISRNVSILAANNTAELPFLKVRNGLQIQNNHAEIMVHLASLKIDNAGTKPALKVDRGVRLTLNRCIVDGEVMAGSPTALKSV